MTKNEVSPEMVLRVRHVYAHDSKAFETEVNDALRRIVAEGGVVGDVKYVIDPSTSENQRGGFGALVIYELPANREIG